MQSFPVRLPTLWRQAVQGLTAGAVTARAWLWLEGEPFSWPQTLPLMVAAAVLVMVLHQMQPTRAGPEGLLLMSAWGWRRHVAWEDITEARLTRDLFLQPAWKLQGRDGRVHWIARETRNLPGLHALALSRGGADHPLTRALEQPMYRL